MGQMYAGDNEPRTVDESYAGAVSGSSLRVGNDHTVPTPGDIIAASGMNQYRTGMALLRLLSEWNSGAVPKQGEQPEVKELARQLARRRVENEIKEAGEPMKISEKRALLEVVTVQKPDMELARAEQQRLQARATNWQMEENKLRFQRLKTLPTIRAGLLHWAQEKGWDSAEQLVADTLRHFLSPVCPACEGRKRSVIPGTSRAVGRECRKCRGTGEADLQHGGRGRALMGHIRQCIGQASSDLREGAHRLRRGGKNDADRIMHRHHEKVADLQRADAEAKEDLLQDTDAVAARFRDSMKSVRKGSKGV